MYWGRLSAWRMATLILTTLAALVALTGCGAQGGAGPLVAARVNGHAITLDDYQAVLRFTIAQNSSRDPSLLGGWQAPSGRVSFATAQQQALETLINVELMREELARQHLTLTQATLNKDANDLRASIDKAQSNPATSADVRALLATLTPSVRHILTVQQAEQTLLAQHGRFPSAHLYAIFTQTRAQAQQTQQQIEHGADFAQVARSSSLDTQSAASGGDVGVFYIGQVSTTFDTLVFLAKTTPKLVIIPTGSTYALVRVTDVAARSVSALASADQQAIVSAYLSDVTRAHAQIERDIAPVSALH